MQTEIHKGDVIVASCPLRIVSGRVCVEIPAGYQSVTKSGAKYGVSRAEVEKIIVKLRT